MKNKRPKPRLLLITELLAPIDLAIKSFENLDSELKTQNSSVIHNSIFAYLVSKYEIMLKDVLILFIKAFPEKLSSLGIKCNEEKDLNKIINNIFYKNINEIIEIVYNKTFSIPMLDNSFLTKINEIKATRNLLIHNDLKINEIYLEKAGSSKRGNTLGDFLPLNITYIEETINILSHISIDFREKINQKYQEYSKLKLIKDLWNYLFDTPMLVFDEIWYVRNDRLYLNFELLKKHVTNCSNSEVSLLGKLIIQWSPSTAEQIFKVSQFNTQCFDTKTREQYLFLTKVLFEKPYLVDGDLKH